MAAPTTSIASHVIRLCAAALLVATLGGCVAYQPTLGMTHQEWIRHWSSSDSPDTPDVLVEEDAVKVYRVGNDYLYFDKGLLKQIDQGEVYNQKYPGRPIVR